MTALADLVEPLIRRTFLGARRLARRVRIEWRGLVREFWESA